MRVDYCRTHGTIATECGCIRKPKVTHDGKVLLWCCSTRFGGCPIIVHIPDHADAVVVATRHVRDRHCPSGARA